MRDYRPGDAPKMIAWKSSARRDRLIVKEYESDVPVRCLLFLDTSDSMRLGPPGHTPLTRMASVAAGVAQAAAGNRDLAGLTAFDERASTIVKPARSKPHTISLLRKLAEIASLQPRTHNVPPDQLLRRAIPLAHQLYPEAMAWAVNPMPRSRTWRPFLDTWFGKVTVVILLWFLFSPLLILIQYSLTGSAASPIFEFWKYWLRSVTARAVLHNPTWSPIFLRLASFAALWLWLFLVPVWMGLGAWFVYGASGWFGKRRADLTRRKQLAALFAAQDLRGAAAIERYIHDDAAFAERVGEFLQMHQARCPISLYDDAGVYRFRDAGKATILADAMVRAVGLARDNELYVILADLTELGVHLAPVLRAVRFARARHHQVLVIIAWPEELPSPDQTIAPVINPEPEDEKASAPWHKRKVSQPKRQSIANQRRGLRQVIELTLIAQYHEAFKGVRQALIKAGATVARVEEKDPIQLILDRLDRLRGMRSRR